MVVDGVGYAKIFTASGRDYGVDQIQHRCSRPEALRQCEVLQFQFGGLDALSKRLACLTVAFGRGSLKSVYRLFEIADRKDRPGLFRMRTGTAVKIVAKCADDVPLRLVGVLRLINQNMVDLPVEFEPHPIRHVPGVQQIGGLADHIVEIDDALCVFGLGILLGKRLADEQRLGEPVGILRAGNLVGQRFGP